MNVKILTSKVFTKVRKANTRIIVMEGSARSTKTYSIIQFIIGKCLEKKRRVTISRAKLTWLRGTCMVDFLEILDTQFQVYDPNSWNKTESTYYFDNGSEVCFVGLDEPQKLHGRKQDIFWINEAVEADYKDFEQMAIRTVEVAILDYNPSYEQHWIYEKVIPRDDCTFIKSTYRDNPFLDPAIRQEIERLEPTPENIRQGTADEVSWKIYGLGERAAHRGLIFNDVDIVKDLPPMSEWKRVFYGIDFGFTNDPTAIIQIVLAHGELFFKQLVYERNLTNIINPKNPKQMSIEQRLIDHKIPKGARIWCDAAEPKSITDLKNCGWFNLGAADKGPDSIKAGIDTIKRFKCHIVESSVDLIKERNNYKWKEDKSGETTNEPIDAWNHAWDAIRYPTYMEMRRPVVSSAPISGHSFGNNHR